ncbi:MAG TPA: LPS export ABC transporter periplasmic protein LptC [Oscillatoriaceae cyanobacterium M33_DOE_052]|uniref:LPS export ABC transporter periplasmic protein LptC n=1 Tax=Planktothricoides sp. SpSt-374 TaxID=2282167 RepID=A0A7C3VTW6_9CYAN|nr:LPS export ABC transporter periplasmic protein LptC [Oscillatoriaceae cyanobacterium M33_DOE_052]
MNQKKAALFVLVSFAFLWLLFGGVYGCQKPNNSNGNQEGNSGEKVEKSLTLKDVTLEQFSQDGKLIWKVISPLAKYEDGAKLALVEQPVGELFRDGVLVYKIQAKSGQLFEKSNKILLQDDVVATDVRSGAVLQGGELEWLPGEDLLLIRENLKGTHPQLLVTAKEARLHSRDRRMELSGQVVATTAEPVFQLRSENLVWQMAAQLVESTTKVQIDRYTCKTPSQCTPTDRATANQGKMNLAKKTATLEKNASLDLSKPPVNVAGDLIVWNLEEKTITSDKPLTILHEQQKTIIKAQKGKLDVPSNIFYLSEGVSGTSTEGQFDLASDQMMWDITKEQIEAEGNVVYRQNNPPMTTRGKKAFGKLQDRTITFSGGEVVTDVIP